LDRRSHHESFVRSRSRVEQAYATAPIALLQKSYPSSLRWPADYWSLRVTARAKCRPKRNLPPPQRHEVSRDFSRSSGGAPPRYQPVGGSWLVVAGVGLGRGGAWPRAMREQSRRYRRERYPEVGRCRGSLAGALLREPDGLAGPLPFMNQRA